MFTETPVTTIVVTPRLRSTGSRSVPAIGFEPVQARLSTRSARLGPELGDHLDFVACPAAAPPATSATPANSRALRVGALAVGPPAGDAVHDLRAARREPPSHSRARRWQTARTAASASCGQGRVVGPPRRSAPPT